MILVPETANDDIAKLGDEVDHWTVFASADDWTILSQHATQAEALAWLRDQGEDR